MCDSCGCNGDIAQMSAAERVKAQGNDLRGSSGEELLEATSVFSDDAGVLSFSASELHEDNGLARPKEIGHHADDVKGKRFNLRAGEDGIGSASHAGADFG